MNWLVYMLECNDNTIYTGITNNLKERLKKHQSGNGAKYLKGRLPIKLMYKELFVNRSEATKREIFIKKMSSKQKKGLIMSQSKYIFIVSMNIKKEFEKLFNEVYDKEHIPYLLNVTGVNKVTRGKGIPFFFSMAGETKEMNSPSQKFVAMYEIDSPEVVQSLEWSVAVEKGRWGTEVRQHTSERTHFMYEYC